MSKADRLPDPALVARDIVFNSTDMEHMRVRIEAELRRAAAVPQPELQQVTADRDSWRRVAEQLEREKRKTATPSESAPHICPPCELCQEGK